nr:cysteine desulfurase family protein [Lysinibacter cavernae]
MYLDNAATTRMPDEVLRAMWAYLSEEFANASSVHAAGQRARDAVDWGRSTVAQLLGGRPSDIVFTSGGTEANNLAVKGLALANPRGRHLVTTAIEHPSVIESCRYLERFHGFELSYVPVDYFGRVAPDALAEALRDDTSLVSIGLANNEVGTVQPIRALADVAHERGALMHTDAVQAVGSLSVSAAELGVDALSCSAHKLGGPKGVGALFRRRSLAIEPVLHGGGQERGARSGTEHVAGIVGFAAAAQLLLGNPDIEQDREELAKSRASLVQRVGKAVPDALLTGDPFARLPGHASWCFTGVSGESIVVALDAAGIAASSGSACAAGHDEPSPVLLAMGLSREVAQSAVRLSLLRPLEPAEADLVVDVLTNAASTRRLQRDVGGAAVR